MTEFKDETDIPDYITWRRTNPDGYVLNINVKNGTNNPKSINIIHCARYCPSLDAPPLANRKRKVQKSHPKLCSTDLNKLEEKMKAEGLPYKLCGRCLKKLRK